MWAPATIALDVGPQHLRDALQAPSFWSELPSNNVFDIQDVSGADVHPHPHPSPDTDASLEAPQLLHWKEEE